MIMVMVVVLVSGSYYAADPIISVSQPGSASKGIKNSKFEVASATSGAKIYYTFDGPTPTNTSTLYTNPVNIPLGQHWFRAIATKQGMNNSEVTSKQFTLRPGSPKIEANKAGASYFTADKTYNGLAEFSLTIQTPDTEIYYTLDGISVPDNYSFQYTVRSDGLVNKLQVRETTKVMTIGYHRPTATFSELKSEDFVIRVRTPQYYLDVQDEVEEPYGSNVFITQTGFAVTASFGSKIYYTIDGTYPDSSTIEDLIKSESASLYSKAFNWDTAGNFTVYAIAMKAGMAPSQVKPLQLVVLNQVPQPTISVGPADNKICQGSCKYDIYVTVKFSIATAAAVTMYVLDGSDPLTSPTAKNYSGPFNITNFGPHKIKYVGVKDGWAPSKGRSATYVVSDRISPVQISASAGMGGSGSSPFNKSATITMGLQSISVGKVPQTGDNWADIHYTIDGSIPTSLSPKYERPIHWATLGITTVRAISFSRIVDEMLPSIEVVEVLEVRGVATPLGILDVSVKPVITRTAFPEANGGCEGKSDQTVVLPGDGECHYTPSYLRSLHSAGVSVRIIATSCRADIRILTYKDSECTDLLQSETVPRSQIGLGIDPDLSGYRRPICRKYACSIVRGPDGSVSATSCAGLGQNEFASYACEEVMDSASSQGLSLVVSLFAALAAVMASSIV